MKRHAGSFTAFFVGIIVIALLCGTAWFAAQAYSGRNAAEGRRLYENGDYSGALAAFQKADKYSLRPRAEVLKGMGDCCLQLQDYDNARTNYTKLTELEPQNVNAHYMVGLLAIRARNYETAEKQVAILRGINGEGPKYADALKSKMEVGKAKGFFTDLLKKVVPSLPSIPGITEETPVKPDAGNEDASPAEN